MKKLFNSMVGFLNGNLSPRNILPRKSVRDIVLIPSSDNTHLTSEKREAVCSVLEKYKVLENLSGYKQYFIKVSDQVAPGASLIKAYKIWQGSCFADIRTPFDLPRQMNDFVCPADSLLVMIECVNKQTPNMGSFWGIDGYVLLILIDLKNKEILDARGEIAK